MSGVLPIAAPPIEPNKWAPVVVEVKRDGSGRFIVGDWKYPLAIGSVMSRLTLNDVRFRLGVVWMQIPEPEAIPPLQLSFDDVALVLD